MLQNVCSITETHTAAVGNADMLLVSGVTVLLNTAEHFQTLGMARSPQQWERPKRDFPLGFSVCVFVF